MTEPSSETVHASCVAIDGRGVLIQGRSGAGKSDLALRLIDRGAMLVSDDYTILTRRDGRAHASAPDRIAGRIEIRGIGLVDMPFVSGIPVAAIVCATDRAERLPLSDTRRRVAGIDLPVVTLELLEPSAPVKVELALRAIAC